MKTSDSRPAMLLCGLLAAACAAPPPSPPPLLRFEHGVRAVLEEQHGDLWFGSHDEGAARWDGERLTYFGVADGLSDEQVRSIQQGPDGALWFEGGRGVSRFVDGRMQVVAARDYSRPGDWPAETRGPWFKGDEATGVNERERAPGVFRLEGDTLVWLHLPLPNDGERNTQWSITGMAHGVGEQLWLATYGAVVGYDAGRFTVVDDARMGFDDLTGHLHVRSVFCDSRGRVWIGNNGIGVLLLVDGDVSHFAPGDRATALAPAMQRVFAIGEDRDGGIWFGTRDDGASRFDGVSLTHFGPDEGLVCRHLWSFYRDRRGDLWATGASPSGVFRFDGTRFEQVF